MSFNFVKKNKSELTFFVILFIILNIINFIYQINYVQKIYKINLSLKHNVIFDFINENNSLQLEDNNQDSISRNIDNFNRTLQMRMKEKISYELNFNKNLLEISKICENLKIEILGRYYFIDCVTSNPNEGTNIIINNLSNILNDTLSDIELKITKQSLNKLGLFQEEINKELFQIINKKISYLKNIMKNFFILNAILIFAIILYLSYLKKFKKIIF